MRIDRALQDLVDARLARLLSYFGFTHHCSPFYFLKALGVALIMPFAALRRVLPNG
jgi:hypothetical protein